MISSSVMFVLTSVLESTGADRYPRVYVGGGGGAGGGGGGGVGNCIILNATTMTLLRAGLA